MNQVKEFVSTDRKARKFWDRAKTEENPRKKEKLRNKAKDCYAKKEALAMMMQNPSTKVNTTNVNIKDSMNGNFCKTKETKVSSKIRFLRKK